MVTVGDQREPKSLEVLGVGLWGGDPLSEGSPQYHVHANTKPHGTQEHEFFEHSTSSGLSQGIHTGIGFREKQGVGNSMDLHVPGIQTEALPMLTQGRM